MLLFVLAYGWLAVTRHQRFNSTGFDLAINEQILWNTLNGRFFASSLEVNNSFADHFRPFLLAVLPFYALFQRPETLLIWQTAVLASAAVPIYLLAIVKLQDKVIALLLALMYLLYPAVGFIARFDFHIEVVAIPAFVAAFLAMDRKRWAWATFFLIIPLLAKENMGLTVAMFGLYAIILLRNYRWGLAWIILGIFTFAATTFWLLPAIRGGALDAFDRYGWLGNSPIGMLAGLITKPGLVWQHIVTPDRMAYLVQLFLPIGFLALLGLPELFLALPGFATNLLADHFCQPTIYCQYAVPIVPFIFIATIVGLFRLKKWWGSAAGVRYLTIILVAFTFFSYLRSNPFTYQQIIPPALQQLENAGIVRMALSVVPKEVSVVTTNDYAPHLAQREGLFILGIPAQKETPTSPDVIFLNLYDQQYIVCDQIFDYLQKIDRSVYGVTFRTGGLLVLQKDAGSNEAFQEMMDNWNYCAG